MTWLRDSPDVSRHELVHRALPYRSDAQFVATIVPFLRDGLARGDRVLAVTTRANIELLRTALGDESDHEGNAVEFMDAWEWYDTPGRTLAAYHGCVRDVAPRRTRVVGEPVWDGRGALETVEWKRYESAINVALAGSGALIVCPYDQRVLDPGVVADCTRTHPEIAEGAGSRPSPWYTDPLVFSTECDQVEMPPPTGVVRELQFARGELPALRAVAAREARAAGLAERRTADYLVAINEVASNAVRHGGGVGTARFWISGSTFFCEIADHGPGFDQPFPGYIRPGPSALHGYGLWVTRQVCDLVDLRTREGGTVVRLHMTL